MSGDLDFGGDLGIEAGRLHDVRLLIVDDDEPSAQVAARVLRRSGFRDVRTVSDSRTVLALFTEYAPDLLILDVRMPHLDGFSVLRQVRTRFAGEYLPVLVVTGDADDATRRQALGQGATDFLTKPYDPSEIILRVMNLLRTRILTQELEARVRERTRRLRSAEVEVAQRLALAAELRDYRGGEHTQRVGRTSALVASALGMPQAEVENIRLAAPLHDVGKLAIPEEILLKPSALTLEELDVVKSHTVFGARMLGGSESPILQRAEEIALYHHENWDGTGYVPGLKGEAIPIAARIVHIADVFDALIHERPYKDPWSVGDAVEWIEERSAQMFDPAVVQAFLQVQAVEDLPLLPGDQNRPGIADRTWQDLPPHSTSAESPARAVRIPRRD